MQLPGKCSVHWVAQYFEDIKEMVLSGDDPEKICDVIDFSYTSFMEEFFDRMLQKPSCHCHCEWEGRLGDATGHRRIKRDIN